jgi:aminomethyltransferase
VVGSNGHKIGEVTSGAPVPFLKKNIGMAYVPVESSAPGTEIRIGIRSQEAAAKIVPLPFYKRPR